MKQTTKTQFREFCRTALEYQQKLGLMDWKLFFEHSPLDDSYAQIDANWDGHIATITMSSQIKDHAVSGFVPASSAKHEMIHLLLYRYHYHAQCRYIRNEELCDDWEALTRTLENLL